MPADEVGEGVLVACLHKAIDAKPPLLPSGRRHRVLLEKSDRLTTPSLCGTRAE